MDQSKASGATPLFIAAQRGHDGCVQALLGRRANPGVRLPKTGDTPLATAAERGHAECVRMLLAAGARVETLSGRVSSGKLTLLSALEGAGAAAQQQQQPRTPQAADEAAAPRAKRRSILARFDKAKPKAKPKRGRHDEDEPVASALWKAASNGHLEVVTQLVRAGANVARAYQGVTPRQVAKGKGHVEIEKVLEAAAAGLFPMGTGTPHAVGATGSGQARPETVLKQESKLLTAQV